MSNDSDIARELGEINGQLRELRNIVVGEDGDGGLRADLKHLTSLRDKGLGVLLVLGLVATMAGSAVRDWIVHLFSAPPPPPTH
jgi:hypothetical protein